MSHLADAPTPCRNVPIHCGRKIHHKGQACFFSVKQCLGWPRVAYQSGQNKNNLILCQALRVRPKGGISGGLFLSSWSLRGCTKAASWYRGAEWDAAGHCNRWPWLSTEQAQRGFSKAREDAEKADKIDWRSRVTLQFRKIWLQAKNVTEAWKIGHRMEMVNREGASEKISRWLKANTNKYFWYITFLNSRTGAVVVARGLVLIQNWTRSWKETI